MWPPHAGRRDSPSAWFRNLTTLYLSKPELVDLDGLPLLQWEGSAAIAANPQWKRALDVALTACLLPLAL
jgi:hypothetical protein